MAETQKQLEDAIQESCKQWLKGRGIPLRGGLTPRRDVRTGTKKK